MKHRRNKKAVSPVISTVIITATIVVLVLVAAVFANNFLSARMAESDFNAAKQFMKTMGLQIDDVAWRIGQTETIRYTSRDGDVNFLNATLNYKIEINTGSGFTLFSANDTGIIFFKMPVSKYTVSNNYYELIWPAQISNIMLKGSSAPVSKVFAVEKLQNMSDGSYIRVVTAPMIRQINSTITTATNSTFYFKLYLPLLSLESAPKKSQSVTLTGNSILVKTKNHITSIKVTVSFPKSGLGYDNAFFNFPSSLQETINTPPGYDDCVIELYTGAVSVELGAHV